MALTLFQDKSFISIILLLFCEPKKSPADVMKTFPVFTSRVGRKTMATKLPLVSARTRDPEEFSEKEVNLHSRGWLLQILNHQQFVAKWHLACSESVQMLVAKQHSGIGRQERSPRAMRNISQPR